MTHRQKRFVVLISGKRRSGKNYVARLLSDRLKNDGYKLFVCGVSDPLKEEYGKAKNISFEELIDPELKETHRPSMITWGESIRKQNPNHYCNLVYDRTKTYRVLVVPDIRRPSDISFFAKKFQNISLVRIESSEEARQSRGYKFVCGIDNAPSECALDNFKKWDYIVRNDENSEMFNIVPKNIDLMLESLCQTIRYKLLESFM